MQSDWYKTLFPNTELVKDQNAKGLFITTQQGFRAARSVGGAVTGEGGDFLIVDDPLNAMEANSTVTRERANEWFDQAFSTRLNNKKEGVIIVIMQRLHYNDLSGHLLAKGGWEHLKIPLIAEDVELYKMGSFSKKRAKGSLLHPARMSMKEVEAEKVALGPYAFAGQFQQNPSPTGGGVFERDWLRFYDQVLTTGMNLYMLVDPANSKRKESDYTAILIMGVGQDGNWYLVDAIRDRLNVREREEAVFKMHAKYKPKLVVYEKYGMQVDSDWIKKAMEERNYRFNLQEVSNKLSKEDRVKRLIPYFADSKIWLPKKLHKTNYLGKVVDLIETFIEEEYVAFPVGLHDDFIDAMSRMCDINVEYPGNTGIDYRALYPQRNRW